MCCQRHAPATCSTPPAAAASLLAPHLQRLLLCLLEEAHVVEARGAVEVEQGVGVGASQQLAVQPQCLWVHAG
jgi:hypothetical protein